MKKDYINYDKVPEVSNRIHSQKFGKAVLNKIKIKFIITNKL